MSSFERAISNVMDYLGKITSNCTSEAAKPYTKTSLPWVPADAM
ncbi:hypothetical protein CC1G_15365 [Coprinopsis cinerea okayama7|uniref:Uncharacterized protein n=1 Tax=Coprinopsis cinerea (strain Okayama-7 / 130 / ATCC MYA-4618 / FGSC 9003) TaxID=240176 RepID=D6RQ44_COPC7|nr:hypothetical protein CC1G_15365 [Coprinopsis cinerea okayama7\|eukprot:XP_002910458.1 hypothetical protein CC1G_15365 [Coprinopsis cinerea okayama7\